MDKRIDTLLQSLLDMRGENRNTIIEGARRLFAECKEQFRAAEFDVRKKDEAVRMCRMLIRDRMVEQIEVEDFPAELLASFVSWLMLNRDGLTILLHPETGNDYADHTEHAVWFGAVLPLRLDVLQGYQTLSAAT